MSYTPSCVMVYVWGAPVKLRVSAQAGMVSSKLANAQELYFFENMMNRIRKPSSCRILRMDRRVFSADRQYCTGDNGDVSWIERLGEAGKRRLQGQCIRYTRKNGPLLPAINAPVRRA
jgi:hypothetical protein